MGSKFDRNKSLTMQIRISIRYIVAFLALTFVLHEAHEIVHTSIGRLICGCWGARDFNVWGLCEGCNDAHPLALVATFAGPVFSFIMLWLGALWLRPKYSDQRRLLGFALLFASMPFARIFTALMGGGDEIWGLSQLMNYDIAYYLGLSLISGIIVYPLYKAFLFITNKGRVLWFLLFFIAPTFIDLLVVLGLMNSLLEHGIGATYWILGSPIIVTAWTASVTTLLLLTWRHLYRSTLKTKATSKQIVKPDVLTNLTTILLLSASATALNAQPDISAMLTPPGGQAEVLLVGAFHFGYPNLDAHKIAKKDQVDICSPKRQGEVEELVDYLAAFRPNKIVVEAGRNTGYLLRRYERWQAGTDTLRANEIDQLAFRLMLQFELDTLYGCDAVGVVQDMFQSVDSTAFNNYFEPIFAEYDFRNNDPMNAQYDAFFDAKTRYTLDTNLLAFFKFSNSEEYIQRNHGAYLIGDFKLPGFYGADALAVYWYSRNLRIFRNIQKDVATHPDDRILILFGAGHVPILHQQFQASPEFKLIKFDDLE